MAELQKMFMALPKAQKRAIAVSLRLNLRTLLSQLGLHCASTTAHH